MCSSRVLVLTSTMVQFGFFSIHCIPLWLCPINLQITDRSCGMVVAHTQWLLSKRRDGSRRTPSTTVSLSLWSAKSKAARLRSPARVNFTTSHLIANVTSSSASLSFPQAWWSSCTHRPHACTSCTHSSPEPSFEDARRIILWRFFNGKGLEMRDHLPWSTNSNFIAWHQHSPDGNHQSITEKWLSTHCSTSPTQHRFHKTLPWLPVINTSEIWTTYSWQLATWQWCHMPLHTHLQQHLRHWNLSHTRFTCRWNHKDLNFQRNHWLLLHHWWRTKIYHWTKWCLLIEGLSHRLLSLTASSATQNFTFIIRNCATTICFPNNSKYTWPLLLHELPTQQAFSTMSQPENATPYETTFSPAFEQHVDTTQQPNNSRPTTSIVPLETISRCLAHQNFWNLMTGSLHYAWNNHALSPTIHKSTWPIRISVSQKHAWSKIPLRQGSESFHQLHLHLMRNPFCFGITTATNYSAYLFIVTTPGKLTGWNWKHCICHHSPQILAHTSRTPWPNKIHPFYLHQCQICL